MVKISFKLFYVLVIAISNNFTYIKSEMKESKIKTCKNDNSKHGYFKFLFNHNGKVNLKEKFEFVGICFQKIEAILTDEGNHYLLKFKGHHKVSVICTETILISNYQHLDYKTMFLGNSSLKIKKDNDAFNNYVASQGFNIMTLCDSVSHLIPNLLSTIKLFLGGFGTNPYIPFFGSHVPDYQVRSNIELIEMYTGYKWKDLQVFDNTDIEKFDSGDVIFITRFDGIDNMIGIGTGSRVGHTTVVLKEGNEKYVYESQQAWYWPKSKVQKNKLSTWIKWAKNADYNVVWVPLSKKSKKKFDVEKGKKFADSLLGQDYGFRNFLFGWLDTGHKNFPYTLNLEFVFFAFRIVEKISKSTTDLIFGEALNARLGTKNLSLQEISKKIVEENLDLGEIISIPEKDNFQYSNGPNYVCSSYVTAILKAGGLFDDLEFNATEVTPRDLYTLNIFNKEEITGCNGKPYCQFIGKQKIELDQYSSREPYNHMYEKCESQAPHFKYNENC